MPKFAVLRSYTVVEKHVVEASDVDKAIALVDTGTVDYFVKSYDGDYHRDKDGEIVYELGEA